MRSRYSGVLLLSAILALGVATGSVAETFKLPERKAPRPETTNSVPHVQIDVETKPDLRDELLRRVSGS